MKILYIGHYRDGTGWGDAALNNILALHKAGVDVVPRAISYNDAGYDIGQTVSDLEKKSTEGCDVCIQHTLPGNYFYNSNFKNIGFIETECSDFSDTGWHKNINTMDELWAPCEYSKSASEKSGVNIPIKIAPHCIDMDQYYNTSNGPKIQEMTSGFTFAFVGEFIERKNLKALLRAFHTEFHPKEPANLFIKTSGQDVSNIEAYCSSVKNGLKIRSEYKKEIILSGKLDKKDYLSVLSQASCFVSPSRGEGFCIPALESMALGLPCIYTEGMAMDEFCIGESVNSFEQPCFGAMDSLPNLYSSNSTWLEIDVTDLQIKMRNMFLSGVSQDLKDKCKTRAREYSHESIGKTLKELLNDE